MNTRAKLCRNETKTTDTLSEKKQKQIRPMNCRNRYK